MTIGFFIAVGIGIVNGFEAFGANVDFIWLLKAEGIWSSGADFDNEELMFWFWVRVDADLSHGERESIASVHFLGEFEALLADSFDSIGIG